MKDLKAIIEVEGIRNVNLTGRKPLMEMSDYYQASDVLIISLKDVPVYEIMIPSKFRYIFRPANLYMLFLREKFLIWWKDMKLG